MKNPQTASILITLEFFADTECRRVEVVQEGPGFLFPHSTPFSPLCCPSPHLVSSLLPFTGTDNPFMGAPSLVKPSEHCMHSTSSNVHFLFKTYHLSSSLNGFLFSLPYFLHSASAPSARQDSHHLVLISNRPAAS